MWNLSIPFTNFWKNNINIVVTVLNFLGVRYTGERRYSVAIFFYILARFLS